MVNGHECRTSLHEQCVPSRQVLLRCPPADLPVGVPAGDGQRL